MTALSAPGNTIPVGRLLTENCWPLIAVEVIERQRTQDKDISFSLRKCYIGNVIVILTSCAYVHSHTYIWPGNCKGRPALR